MTKNKSEVKLYIQLLKYVTKPKNKNCVKV